MADEVKAKKEKKLSKLIEGNLLTITEGITGTVLKFDAGTLPAEIQKKLMPYGLSQKLGDAAAGKKGQEAIDSIKKVFDGLMKNDWTTRAPAAEKVSKKGILDKFNSLPAKEQAIARGLLEKLGILPTAQA